MQGSSWVRPSDYSKGFWENCEFAWINSAQGRLLHLQKRSKPTRTARLMNADELYNKQREQEEVHRPPEPVLEQPEMLWCETENWHVDMSQILHMRRGEPIGFDIVRRGKLSGITLSHNKVVVL